MQEILDHAAALAERFENYEPTPEDERDAPTFLALRDAVYHRSQAELALRSAVATSRQHGYSWASIGSLLGTSGEAARQRYGSTQRA